VLCAVCCVLCAVCCVLCAVCCVRAEVGGSTRVCAPPSVRVCVCVTVRCWGSVV
jgi:hypothetical protein